MPAVVIHEYVVADACSGPYAVTTGPDGALWFTMVHSGEIGRLLPGDEPTRHRLDPGCGPTIIVTGPDHALWFTEYRAHRIGRITIDGAVHEFELPTPDCGPFGIATGPDGAL
jgi:virginiamycin B lyase